MATSTSRVVLKLTSDARLAAAVGGAVGFFADQARLDARARADLIAAAEEACRETLPLLTPAEPLLGVQIEALPDRIEVTLEHHGQPVPTVGLESFAAPAGEGSGASGASGLRLLSRVDRVQYNTAGGTSRMTLIKYLGAPRGRE